MCSSYKCFLNKINFLNMEVVNQLELDFFICKLTNMITLVMVVLWPLFIGENDIMRSSLPNIVWVINSRRMRWAGHVVCMGGRRGTHRVLVGKIKVKRQLGKPRRRWEDTLR